MKDTTEQKLFMFLHYASAQLKRGEFVPVDLPNRIESFYERMKLSGFFMDLMLIKKKNGYHLGRVF